MKILITGGSGFIGTNLVEYYTDKIPTALLNIDNKKPFIGRHSEYWKNCDILDLNALSEAFAQFRPSHVIHMAARTDTSSDLMNDYRVNTEGTANVLEAVRRNKSVERFIMISSQFVHKPGHLPENDEDFEPHTAYGQSKVINEKQTRSAGLGCIWTIIRPTNIWGPWHPRYPREFWHILKKGLYVHPGKKPVIRSYGYVGNIVYQIDKMFRAPKSVVDRKVYYVGDKPINLLDWANGFSKAINGRNVIIVPRCFLRIFGIIGDQLIRAGIKFPMRTSRYQSMTMDYATPMDPVIEAFGEPPYSLNGGIEETVKWLGTQGFFE